MFNVLGLFDGMSCGQIALERAGFKYDNYYASEIDQYAIKVALKNYPDTIQLGDITSLKTDRLPPIDLLMGGSPCQSFSVAGDQTGFDGKSGLFWEFVRVFNEVKPKWFLFENVKMKKEWRDIISRELGVEPVLINSALVSAQNRQRYYWTNITDKQPKDKGIKLCDILEEGIDDRDKSFCLDASYFKGSNNMRSYIEFKSRQIVFTERRTDDAKRIRKKFRQAYNIDWSPRRAKELVARDDDKVNCLTTSLTKEHILAEMPEKSQTILSTMHKENVKSMLKRKKNGLLVVGKAGMQVVGQADLKGNDILKRVYHPEGKSPTVTANKGGNQEPKVAVNIDDLTYRKLTPIECERLQTVPDNYTSEVSNTQRYRMIGNGWTVDIIAHILNYINDRDNAFQEVKILDIFK